MALEQWVPRVLDTGRADPTKEIHLTVHGRPFERWSVPVTAEDVVAAGRAIMASIKDESPKGQRVEIMFTAMGTSGEVTSTEVTSVIGINAQADSMIGSGGGSAKAFSDAMMGMTATMNTLIKASREMVENVMKANEALTAQIVDLREYNDAMQDELLKQKQQETGLSDVLMEQIKNAGPLAIHAIELLMEGSKNKSTGAAAKAVVNGINQVTNGAS